MGPGIDAWRLVPGPCHMQKTTTKGGRLVTTQSVPENGWACATCHSALNTYTPTGEGMRRFIHPAFADCAESRPVRRGEVAQVKEVCDFCTAEWAEVSFQMTEPEDDTFAHLESEGTGRKALNRDYDVVYTKYSDTGDELVVTDKESGWAWAACAICADLFDRPFSLGKLLSRIKAGHRTHGPRSAPRALLEARIKDRQRVRVPGRFTLDGQPIVLLVKQVAA